ncbi:MAG: glycoside hydrolase family 1 protein [Candidatus Eisenbacteria bacterium]|nr:glycoside hydrolase family 1 protein [Candidatus Eisenbacteria bacterium]
MSASCGAPPGRSASVWPVNDARVLRFPDGFRWGAATSAHQVEGGNTRNDWWRFEATPGAIRGGRGSGDACRHYERFEEDFDLAAADGHTAHRLSLEWSRLEPEPGRFDPAEVAHYHAVLGALRARGMEPVVTLHHFTNPLWIADRGGWESRETIDRFVAFARFCAAEFGAEVDWWCTVNEPEVFAFRGWAEGVWPPAVRDRSRALVVIAHQLEAHGRAYRAIHEADRVDADGDGHAARVGFAKHHVQLEALRAWHPLDRLVAHFERRVFNEAVERAAVDGRIALEIPCARAVRRDVPELKGALDWFGLNYYTRWRVQAFAEPPHVATPGAPVNDLGWEVWPDGLRRALHAAGRTGAPVLVTENGVADAHDALRPRAIVEFAEAMHRAIAEGVPVRGYLHWSLLDNFEWADGWHGRFGLYGVDERDPGAPRVRRRSAEVFARLARANAVTPDVREAAGLA